MKKHLARAAAAMLLAGAISTFAQEPLTLDSRGSFHYWQQLPSEVFGSIAKLMKLELVLDSRVTRKVSIQLEQQTTVRTFLNAACESAGCRWRIEGKRLIVEWDAGFDGIPRPEPKFGQVADAVNVPVPTMKFENEPLALALATVTKLAHSGCRVSVPLAYRDLRVTAVLSNTRLLDAIRTLVTAAARERRELVVTGNLDPRSAVPTNCVIGIDTASPAAPVPQVQAPKSALAQNAPPPRPQAPTFRSRATLVPLDVQVLDSRGQPITDLTADDFTVLEDGVPQHVSHLLVQHLATEKSDEARRTPPPAPPGADGLTLQTGRVFLIVLGRGRLQEPSEGLDGLIHFVGHQLLPQDYAAVLAYNRATRFTRSRDVLLGVLERFKAKNDWLDTRIRFYFSGPQALFSKEIPRYIQSEIDTIFPPTDRVATTQTGLSALFDKETLNGAGSIFERDARATRGTNNTGFEIFDRLLPEDAFDAYVANAREAMDDIEKILCGIDYLGRFYGEKHLIFVTERGFFMPKEADGDAVLARVANNARVKIDIVQTGGLEAPLDGNGTAWSPLSAWSPMQSIVNIAFLTGGQSSRFDFARNGLDKIDRTTLTGYLIGYYPSNPSRDGRYRKLDVRVNRRGASALFRHGYDATDEPVVDRRTLLTLRRVSAAGALAEDVENLNLRLDASLAKTPAASTEVVVNLAVAASGLSWVAEGGRHVVTLDIAIYCADSRERIIGESWKRATLKLTDDTYEAALRDGLPYVVRVAVKGTPKFVKAIVYDYGADSLGSRMKTLK